MIAIAILAFLSVTAECGKEREASHRTIFIVGSRFRLVSRGQMVVRGPNIQGKDGQEHRPVWIEHLDG